jgi:hypothetical protein
MSPKHCHHLRRNFVKFFEGLKLLGNGRTVPVLLTIEVKTLIDMLVQTRGDVGVSFQNKFIFARPNFGSQGHIRGSDCIRELSEECGTQHPELLCSTKLRFLIATLS